MLLSFVGLSFFMECTMLSGLAKDIAEKIGKEAEPQEEEEKVSHTENGESIYCNLSPKNYTISHRK